MRKRQSFVSTSSSSSFILAYPKGLKLEMDHVLPEHIEVFRGFKDRNYTREQAYAAFEVSFYKKNLSDDSFR